MSSKTAGRLVGQVVLITSSESGIGRETARAFCQQGAAMVLNGRQAERLEATRQALAAEGYPVAACVADVTDYAACERLVATVICHFGWLDILITNASIFMRAYFVDMPPGVFRQVLDSSGYGSVYPLKAALPTSFRLGAVSRLFPLSRRSTACPAARPTVPARPR